MSIKYIVGAVCACLTVVSFGANAMLVERLGGLAYYDDEADLTWLADANALAGSAFDDGFSTTDGFTTWGNAMAWADGLTVNGVGGWRLPTTKQLDLSCGTQDGFGSSGLFCANSEMGNMFYNVLGGVALDPVSTSINPNISLFENIDDSGYWSSTLSTAAPNFAWHFLFGNGIQFRSLSNNSLEPAFFESRLRAWAVRDGDVPSVPVPAAVWLFGSGLVGLIGVARRKKI